MPRSTSAPARNKRKKKIFKAAKGYFGGRKNLYRTAKDAVEKGLGARVPGPQEEEAEFPAALDRPDQRGRP